MIRSGTADLPLHYGKVPAWLWERMSRLGLLITELVLAEHGCSGWIARMSDPFWFQALGCVMGMDWHSSGITTSVLGALKHAVNPRSRELGIYICGGRGNHSRKTPEELLAVSDAFATPGDQLARASRLCAKVDNSCLQDGFQLYLHTFSICRSGEWAVVQQGMNRENGMARRYHWHSAHAGDFLSNPQTAVVGRPAGSIINFSDSRAAAAREAVVDFTHLHPDLQRKELLALGLIKQSSGDKQLELFDRHLVMPRHHDLRPEDVSSGRLGAILAAAYSRNLPSFSDALLMPGVGPRTLQSLALVSEVVYGRSSRFTDPARFSFAHGGKDGHPFPVPLRVYDETIATISRAVRKAGLGQREEADSLKRLHRFTLEVEQRCQPDADVVSAIARERSLSHRYGGRTVLDEAPYDN